MTGKARADSGAGRSVGAARDQRGAALAAAPGSTAWWGFWHAISLATCALQANVPVADI
ncbi:MAG: hypothetical protein ACYDAG_14645 [Chloroflexota bacterium]